MSSLDHILGPEEDPKVKKVQEFLKTCLAAGLKKNSILKVLSFPRFTAHAVFIPFLFTTVAEIGKELGISWLESSKTQLIMIIAATIVGVYSRIQFVRGEGITLADPDEDVPYKALQRDLVWFTYVVSHWKNYFLYQNELT